MDSIIELIVSIFESVDSMVESIISEVETVHFNLEALSPFFCLLRLVESSANKQQALDKPSESSGQQVEHEQNKTNEDEMIAARQEQLSFQQSSPQTQTVQSMQVESQLEIEPSVSTTIKKRKHVIEDVSGVDESGVSEG